LCINEITQAEYQVAKPTTQDSRTNKDEKQRERLRPKIELPIGFPSTQRNSTGTTET
jgi:hypothetical protein